MATSKSDTLTPDTVATVTVTDALLGVWVVNRSESGDDIWVRTDGVVPTVGGDDCIPVSGAVHFPDADANRDGTAVVKLIASTAMAYTVQAGSADETVGGGGGGSASSSGGGATAAKQDTQITYLGALTETAPASDTASSGLNGRLQRIAQRLTTAIASLASILAKLPALGTAGTASTDVITVQGIASGTAQAVSAASLPLPSGAATEATLAGVLTTTDFDTKVGSLTETAPATDTASSGVNGRLQRIAQRLTSIIALLPGSLGQKASAASLAVVVASDQSAIPVSDPSAAATTAVALTGSDQAISATAKDYRGFTIEETAGSTAKVVIYDDDDAATGTPLEIISLAANESRSEFYRSGIRASVGIYVDVVSGSVAGSVRVGP